MSQLDIHSVSIPVSPPSATFISQKNAELLHSAKNYNLLDTVGSYDHETTYIMDIEVHFDSFSRKLDN